MEIDENEQKAVPIEGFSFVVNETPYCLWSLDGGAASLRFVNGIDPEYFDHIASIHGDLLEGEEKHYSATALRVAYGQGLETLFALIGALVQANTCIVGWMLKYSNSDLYEVVRKIHTRESIITGLRNPDVTWNAIANVVLKDIVPDDPEKGNLYIEAFAKLWERFAEDFLDEKNRYEYNSIKHGSRAYMSDHHVRWGVQDAPGIPAPPERMTTMSYSEFGASFLVPVKLHDRHNFTVQMIRRNWHPLNMAFALQFISMSISNLINAIKLIYGADPSELKFTYPTNIEDFGKPWEKRSGALTFSMNALIEEKHVKPLTKEEILAYYDVP